MRVEGWSKTSATLRPSSAREARRSAFSSSGALQQGAQLGARNLLAGEEVTGHPEIVVRALSWNLFHGRDFPPDPSLSTWRSRLLRITERGPTYAQVNRPLLPEFAGVLAGMEWDFALLQEAPPRWLGPAGPQRARPAERSRSPRATRCPRCGRRPPSETPT